MMDTTKKGRPSADADISVEAFFHRASVPGVSYLSREETMATRILWVGWLIRMTHL